MTNETPDMGGMSKTGYFINKNNYIPCEHCRAGYNKLTMLCINPYYKHLPVKIVSKINLLGITS